MRRLVVLSFLALAGCATTMNYKRMVDTWIGHNITELVGSWGYPTRTFTAPNGNTVYAYERAASYVATMNTPTYSTVNGYGNTATVTNWGGNSFAVPVTNYCYTYFEVNVSSQIVSWTAQGNACVSN